MTALKEIPKAATKQEIRKWYNKISTVYVERVMNQAILEINKTRPDKLQRSIRVHSLTHPEILFVVGILGTPNGYEPIEGEVLKENN